MVAEADKMVRLIHVLDAKGGQPKVGNRARRRFEGVLEGYLGPVPFVVDRYGGGVFRSRTGPPPL
jgi:hypothetical protein